MDVGGPWGWARQAGEMDFLASESGCSRGHDSAPEGGDNNSSTPIRNGAAPVCCFATALAYCSVLRYVAPLFPRQAIASRPVQVQNEYAQALRKDVQPGDLQTWFMNLEQSHACPTQEPLPVHEPCREQQANLHAQESDLLDPTVPHLHNNDPFPGTEQLTVAHGVPPATPLATAPDTGAATLPHPESVYKQRPDQKLVVTVFSGIGVFDLSAEEACTLQLSSANFSGILL